MKLQEYEDYVDGEILFESIQDTVRMLEDAIANKFVCNIDYRGERPGILFDGIRIVEPYAVGTDSKGNTLLRAWLIRGVSRTGKINPRLVPGWRLFRLDRIRTLTPTQQTFEVAKKGYNPRDSMMNSVLFAAQF